MDNIMDLDLITCFFHKKHHIDVYRDKHGKYFVRNNGVITQKRLTSKEIVRYLSNLANDR